MISVHPLTNGIKKGYTNFVQRFPCGSNSVVECLVANENVASSSLVSRFLKNSRPYKGGCFFDSSGKAL
jgi:hypothetical protein